MCTATKNHQNHCKTTAKTLQKHYKTCKSTNIHYKTPYYTYTHTCKEGMHSKASGGSGVSCRCLSALVASTVASRAAASIAVRTSCVGQVLECVSMSVCGGCQCVFMSVWDSGGGVYTCQCDYMLCVLSMSSAVCVVLYHMHTSHHIHTQKSCATHTHNITSPHTTPHPPIATCRRCFSSSSCFAASCVSGNISTVTRCPLSNRYLRIRGPNTSSPLSRRPLKCSKSLIHCV